MSKETIDKNLKEFITHLEKMNSNGELEEFLRAILTPKELEEIPTRLQIVKQLMIGIPQHTIAKNLGVGVATVTRGSKELQKGRFKSVHFDEDELNTDASQSWRD